VACELLLSQLALLLELSELGLLREDFLFPLLDARHVASCEVALKGKMGYLIVLLSKHACHMYSA
jgi:hypothetical protein